jgi:hypothetical protein
VGVPIAILTNRVRRLLRLGYGPEDIALALRTSFARRREEFLYEFGAERGTRERLFRVASIGGLGLGAGAIALAIAGVHSPAIAPIGVLGGYLGLIATIFSRKWARLREGKGSIFTRFWQGKPGQLIGKIASFKLGQRAVPADRPTELAIAMSAESVYASFPKELRQSLGDVPEALRGLEAHARLARARIAELDAAIADARHKPGRGASSERQQTLVKDLEAARAQAEARLSEVVTSLENLRLDLLRLRAGAGTPEGITRDVAAARMLGEEADRLLAAASEVDRALARR